MKTHVITDSDPQPFFRTEPFANPPELKPWLRQIMENLAENPDLIRMSKNAREIIATVFGLAFSESTEDSTLGSPDGYSPGDLFIIMSQPVTQFLQVA